jgi:hypothetical protein
MTTLCTPSGSEMEGRIPSRYPGVDEHVSVGGRVANGLEGLVPGRSVWPPRALRGQHFRRPYEPSPAVTGRVTGSCERSKGGSWPLADAGYCFGRYIGWLGGKRVRRERNPLIPAQPAE